MRAIVGDANWDNYTIEAKIRLDKGNWAGLLFIVIKNGEWIHMKVKVEKDKFTLFLNGKEQGTGSSGIKYNKGKIGVWCWETQASFDDFKVYGPGIEGSAVEPQKKLALTWGKLKRSH